MTGPGAAGYLPPLEFAEMVLGVQLWSKQREVLAALPGHRRVAVKSGNGLGKGFCAAVAVLWFLHCHDPAVVLSTAPTFRQVRHILWRQIRRLYRPVKERLGGRMLDTRWELGEDRYALGLSAESADEFQGFHSPNMFVVVDEAEGVKEEIFEAVEAVMTAAEPRLLLIGNPTTVEGAFHRAFHQERLLYETVSISALESPNVQAGKVVVPGLTSLTWVEERKQIWGDDNPIYRARVLAEFPEQVEGALIRLSHIEAAARRWAEAPEAPDGPGEPEVVLGVDVARFGRDRSVILRRRGHRVEEIRVLRGQDTMKVAGWVVQAAREFQPTRICVDEIGVGAGVVDRLRELGYPARGITASSRAREPSIFVNLRAEGYWRLRELFSSGDIQIPPDNQLIGELAALRYEEGSYGRIKMEDKDLIRRAGRPSPDKADALMLAFLDGPGRTRLWT